MPQRWQPINQVRQRIALKYGILKLKYRIIAESQNTKFMQKRQISEMQNFIQKRKY